MFILTFLFSDLSQTLFLSIPTPTRLKRLQQAYATNLETQKLSPSTSLRASTSTGLRNENRDGVENAGFEGSKNRASKPRFSSSTVNERSGTRIVSRDARANVSLHIFSSLFCS